MRSTTLFSILFFCIVSIAVCSANPLLTVNDTCKWVIPNDVTTEAGTFPLQDVHLLNSPFLKAQQADERYLLLLSPDRLLSMFRSQAGLTPKAPPYGGWEQTQVAGHTLGHYLSAISRMYVITRNPEFKNRVDYIVSQLARVQDKWGDGYVAAIPGGHAMFEKVRTQGIDPHHILDGFWAPWYVIHKDLAGLLDAYRFCNNQQALQVAKGLGNWTIATTQNLSATEWQEMLSVEQGGMNEALANLYALTGDKRYLVESRKFYHKYIMDPLALGEDHLAGNHCNTQIPKVIGQARLYELRGNPRDKKIAITFWNASIKHHCYSIGDISSGEYYQAPNQLASTLAPNTCETCCEYNLLKLTRHLFCWQPKAEYGDFMERALYNDILASQNPQTGMLVYYMPLSPVSIRKYSTPFDSFWCCVGTGIENHARYGESIYFHSHNDLYVNLYIPSTLNWENRGLMLTQRNRFPDTDTTTLTVDCKTPQSLTMRFRCPYWIARPMQVFVNGKLVLTDKSPTSWATVNRTWHSGDTIQLVMPMNLHLDPTPDKPSVLSVMYGPLVLAADMGPASVKAPQNPVFFDKNQAPASWLHVVSGETLTYSDKSNSTGKNIYFRPFFSNYDDYSVPYISTGTRSQFLKAEEDKAHRILELQSRTVDKVVIGDPTSEKQHNLQGSNTSTGSLGNQHWRDAENGGWFSYQMNLDSSTSFNIRVVYWGSDTGGREFDILVDGTKIATQSLTGTKPGKFMTVVYPIPQSLTMGKDSIVVKFQAKPDNYAGGIFGLRVLKLTSEQTHQASHA